MILIREFLSVLLGQKVKSLLTYFHQSAVVVDAENPFSSKQPWGYFSHPLKAH